MLRAINLLRSSFILTLLLYLAIYIEALPQRVLVIITYETPSHSALVEPTRLNKIPTSFKQRRRWLKTRIQYYSNSSASYNATTSAILVCGDVHPNPGSTPFKEAPYSWFSLKHFSYRSEASRDSCVESSRSGEILKNYL